MPDNPLRALLVHATTARAIVVGRRERPSGPGMTMGSTSRGLVEFAACPGVVVEPGRPAGPVVAERGAHASG